MIGTVSVALGVSVNACMLCPWLKAPGTLAAFGLKLIVTPKMPPAESFAAESLNHPLRPDGTSVSKRGEMRGKLFESDERNWHPPEKLKLDGVSVSL